MGRPCDHRDGEPRPEVCAVCRKYVTSEPHRRLWDADRPKRTPAKRPAPAAPDHGPGTELVAMLASVGIEPDSCKCKARARAMNAWGVEGCNRKRAEIVAWLTAEREARGWREKLKAAGWAVLTGLVVRVNPLDQLGSLVDEAIRRAEAKTPKMAPPPVRKPARVPAQSAPVIYPPPGRRHLLYHLLPVRGAWRGNVNQLLKRITLFDGIRVVAVMTATDIPYRPTGLDPDPARRPLELDDPEVVESALAGHGIEVVRVPNDPNLREVASYEVLFERLKAVYRPGDVALWAHAKGTTRHPGHPAERWTAVLYAAMLDYWPVVEEVLLRHPLAGCFKKYGHGWNKSQSSSDWHYSGSWFWVRCDEFFVRDWRKIDRFWSGVEPLPSQHFADSEAGIVFMSGRVRQLNLYNARLWDQKFSPAWKRWKRQHKGQRREWGMHPAVRGFVEAWAQALPHPVRVLDVGSRNVNGTVRDLFPTAEYVGIDRRPGSGVDIVADGTTWQSPSSFDLVLCLEVLEHHPNPSALCRNLIANARPGGVILITAAGPDRPPHGIDGGEVGHEHYANITTDQLVTWLHGCTVATSTDGQDVRAVAIKGVSL